MSSAPEPPVDQVTRLLSRLDGGDGAAAEELFPLVYDELRQLAGRHMAGQAAGHTLQPTALVNEAFARLVSPEGTPFESRRHFLAVASTAMRSVLVDHARKKKAGKRGGGWDKVPLEGVVSLYEDRALDLVSLDEALQKLGALDAQLVKLVELRFFAGLENAEVADVLGVSVPTVVRGWRTARAWLASELGEAG